MFNSRQQRAIKGQVKFEKNYILFLLLSVTYPIILSHTLIKTQNLSLKTTFHVHERNTFFIVFT